MKHAAGVGKTAKFVDAGEKSVSELLREVASELDSTASPQPERALQQGSNRDEAVSDPCHKSSALTIATTSTDTTSSTHETLCKLGLKSLLDQSPNAYNLLNLVL